MAAHSRPRHTTRACRAAEKAATMMAHTLRLAEGDGVPVPFGNGAVSAKTKQDLDREGLVVGAAHRPPRPAKTQRSPGGAPKPPEGPEAPGGPRSPRGGPKPPEGPRSPGGTRNPGGARSPGGARDTTHPPGTTVPLDQAHQPGGPGPGGSTKDQRLHLGVGKGPAAPIYVGPCKG